MTLQRSHKRPVNSKQKQGHMWFQEPRKGRVRGLVRVNASVKSTKIRTAKRTSDLGSRKPLVTPSIILLDWSRWKLNSLGLKSEWKT